STTRTPSTQLPDRNTRPVHRTGSTPRVSPSADVAIRRIARPLAALVDPMNPARTSPAPTLHRGEPRIEGVKFGQSRSDHFRIVDAQGHVLGDGVTSSADVEPVQ